MKAPDQCQSMLDVRAGVDSLDRKIVALLARRFEFMEAAARIKPDRGDVRDEVRKAAVLSNVRALAVDLGLSPEIVGDLYEMLVERSIRHELRHFDRLAGKRDPVPARLRAWSKSPGDRGRRGSG